MTQRIRLASLRGIRTVLTGTRLQMNATQVKLARMLNRDINQHLKLMGTHGSIDHAAYERGLSASQQAQSLAAYLGEHLVGLDRDAWDKACGLPGRADRAPRQSWRSGPLGFACYPITLADGRVIQGGL